MGLFDKLFGSSGSEVLNKLKDAAESIAKEAETAINSATGSGTSKPAGTAPAYAPAQSSASYGETSGFSWGPDMPDEENQFNSGKTYQQYFYDLYIQSFPLYRLTHESVRKGSATLINFWDGDRKVLVVELMSETSCAEGIRLACGREGVAYLRFYYNHEGWWNTKSYVIQRTRDALNR